MLELEVEVSEEPSKGAKLAEINLQVQGACSSCCNISICWALHSSLFLAEELCLFWRVFFFFSSTIGKLLFSSNWAICWVLSPVSVCKALLVGKNKTLTQDRMEGQMEVNSTSSTVRDSSSVRFCTLSLLSAKRLALHARAIRFHSILILIFKASNVWSSQFGRPSSHRQWEPARTSGKMQSCKSWKRRNITSRLQVRHAYWTSQHDWRDFYITSL